MLPLLHLPAAYQRPTLSGLQPVSALRAVIARLSPRTLLPTSDLRRYAGLLRRLPRLPAPLCSLSEEWGAVIPLLPAVRRQSRQ